MIKVESMDAVHGRSGVTKAVKPPSNQNGALALRGLVVCPTVTSSLEPSGGRSPYHRNGNACFSFAWCCFVDCFIHKNGNDSAGVIALWRVRDSAEDAEPMCALSRRQSLLRGEGIPRGWRPRRALSPGLESLVLSRIVDDIWDVLSRRGPSRGKIPREAHQTQRAWSLVKSSEECCGPWQAGPWYPGFHCADT